MIKPQQSREIPDRSKINPYPDSVRRIFEKFAKKKAATDGRAEQETKDSQGGPVDRNIQDGAAED